MEVQQDGLVRLGRLPPSHELFPVRSGQNQIREALESCFHSCGAPVGGGIEQIALGSKQDTDAARIENKQDKSETAKKADHRTVIPRC
jgi:hypothetical protein